MCAAQQCGYNSHGRQTDLSSLIPAIKRARGYRLYDYRSRRYLDLWQNGGQALLGHRSFRLTSTIKDVISKGLLADLPSQYSQRLLKALSAMFPAYAAFRVVSSPDAALELASLYLGRKVKAEDIRDPAVDGGSGAAQVAFWRPLLPGAEAGSLQGGHAALARVLLPVLPFAMARAPAVLCFISPPRPGFPGSEVLSPVILAGALRCLHDLRRYRLPEWCREDLLREARGWRQHGIYILAECPPERYEQAFAAFLQNGVLLHPRYPGPSLLPAEASPEELQKMIRLFREIPGE